MKPSRTNGIPIHCEKRQLLVLGADVVPNFLELADCALRTWRAIKLGCKCQTMLSANPPWRRKRRLPNVLGQARHASDSCGKWRQRELIKKRIPVRDYNKYLKENVKISISSNMCCRYKSHGRNSRLRFNVLKSFNMFPRHTLCDINLTQKRLLFKSNRDAKQVHRVHF